MKLKNSFFYTLRENVKDEDSVSSNLLVRAGMIKKSSAGVYMILPLGYKVLENIRYIIKDEMDKIYFLKQYLKGYQENKGMILERKIKF